MPDDWFTVILVSAAAIVGAIFIGMIVWAAFGTPGVETRQEHFQRIDREIQQLQEQVAELQKK